jgi:L-malate glycosyltransferase
LDRNFAGQTWVNMRILYFTRQTTVHDHRFLTALAKTGNQVLYMTLEKRDQASRDIPLPNGIQQILWAGGQRPYQKADFPVLLADFSRVIRETQPDLIQAGPLHLSAYLAAMAGFQPLVSMSWGYDLLFDAPRDAEVQEAIRYTLQHSAAMVGDCNTIRQLAINYGMPDEQIVTFPWGIDLAHFVRKNHCLPAVTTTTAVGLTVQTTFTLLSTRGWEPIYGVDVLARGFAEAARQHPELQLVMLGSGSQADLIRRIFLEAGVLERVSFQGQAGYGDLPGYYQSADLYISASHSDGTSISLLEALACGVPALVSDIPGNREWIEPGVQGWWFHDNDPHDLARAITYALNNRQNLSGMGLAARSLAEQRADWNKNFPELFKAYRIALAVKTTAASN